MDCNLVNNSNNKASKVLCTLVPNKHKNTITEFHFIQLWFTDQNNRPKSAENTLKEFGFLLFTRKFGGKYGKKLMDTATKKEINAAKTASKWIVKKNCRSYRWYDQK